MPEPDIQSTNTVQRSPPNYSMPNQIADAQQTMSSLVKLLTDIPSYLITLRRQFRGEALYQSEDGNSNWIQIQKPVFVKMDFSGEHPRPIKKKQKMPWGEVKEIYVPNDEAIDEILSMLYFGGANQIQPLGFNPQDNFLDDLREFGCKLAAVLALKQVEWGLDKEMLPMVQFKIKTIIQDVRSMSLQGNTLKALQTTVSRVEQLIEGEKKQFKLNPYGN